MPTWHYHKFTINWNMSNSRLGISLLKRVITTTPHMQERLSSVWIVTTTYLHKFVEISGKAQTSFMWIVTDKIEMSGKGVWTNELNNIFLISKFKAWYHIDLSHFLPLFCWIVLSLLNWMRVLGLLTVVQIFVICSSCTYRTVKVTEPNMKADTWNNIWGY